jgi:hypothetical protein
MTPRTMVARFPGTCLACRAPIVKGSTIVYGGKGNVRHGDCSDAPKQDTRGTGWVRGSYTSNGRTYSRGRCEDAPCCGCCD